MYQLPLNPMQLMMLGQSQNNPQQQQQLMNTFGLMNYTSPAGYFANQESQLPSFLQLGSSTGATQGSQAKQSFMQNTGKPSNAAARAGEAKYSGGGGANSFAMQRTAANKAAMNTQANQVSQDAQNAELQRVLAMRQSYMGAPGGQDSFSGLSMPSQQSYTPTMGPQGSNPNPGPGGSGFAGGMSIAKGVDNFLGGAGSNLLSNLGSNLGHGLNSFMTSPANPLSGLFGQRQYP